MLLADLFSEKEFIVPGSPASLPPVKKEARIPWLWPLSRNEKLPGRGKGNSAGGSMHQSTETGCKGG